MKLLGLLIFLVCLISGSAFAEEVVLPKGRGIDDFIAYFIAMGMVAAVATLAQSKVITTALEGIARNPSTSDKLFTPMILGLALIESLVIFTFVSVFMVK
ncbi:MAG: hypothetical protein A2381_16085 [Bdellovibrionales bacterium RIFOXYB1_FULL_37_110]|nr:MAG: hypothetical protein A2417_07935 [Bdellovibrionales bacterium RIFOXYC1_FULL_37_79]OFZ57167.1 MAG: hypothetical protein A2381_16085 [Bdellovibrionales bacterium RIFOXYB1_FULL_37_110]OFZ65415.1 MAG: hypothetical protein A2577_03785 [Bdellovibrionales bacterium RIFOXYD1_FULL_36_51]